MKDTKRPHPKLFAGKTPLRLHHEPIRGELVLMDGEEFYRISNYDALRPFFLTIVSAGDLWMFVSSTGALTAGRCDPDHALFPYQTDDKIHDSAAVTGPKSVFIVSQGGRDQLWEPFSAACRGIYETSRNLYKSVKGNQLIFEELNQTLGLHFRYAWNNSRRFGFVRRALLTNVGKANARIRLADGLQNLMPAGVGSQFQTDKSTLLDAYKKSELVERTGLALYRLSSIPIDRPEPAESLKTTTVFSVGLERGRKLLCTRQLGQFYAGQTVRQETSVRAERGAFLVCAEISLKPGGQNDWWMVADVEQGPSAVAELNFLLKKPARLKNLIRADIERGTQDLERLVASADGIQKSGYQLGDIRHFNNVLFNIMRGGVFERAYEIDAADLHDAVRRASRKVARKNKNFFRKLPSKISYFKLIELAAATRERDLERLCREYLPLSFSRRHGDPSRPWNRFSIGSQAADGTHALNYEGNWRDIFQNWEALAVAYPGYVTGMICRFCNASTADGYNPYRITRDGIDWEVIDSSDPWSHIGYWGDHQVIYLLKLLEIAQRHEPRTLNHFLSRDIFAYANVPYRINAFEKLVRHPKETIEFDEKQESLVHERVKGDGADGKLVWDDKARVKLVNLTEKLLVLTLAKISNFIPEAGIWLNTQRPEWNDANNALVGNGASMVTLYHLRRFLVFCRELFRPSRHEEVEISAEVKTWLERTLAALQQHRTSLDGTFNEASRGVLLNSLGIAASEYRRKLYKYGLSDGRKTVKLSSPLEFIEIALDFMDHSIHSNRRDDGLYHSYNLIQFQPNNAITIRRMYEMLEGQVAVLSSGCLSAKESADLLQALHRSAMFRKDQNSYLLYPNRELPTFLEKNNLSADQVQRSKLLQALLRTEDRTLVERDRVGRIHFNSRLQNRRDVEETMDEFSQADILALVRKERNLILDIFEKVFDHESFTGRSGTFFGYEGLGCIYWHMVSKLLLASQEAVFRAVDGHSPERLVARLARAYYDIREGIGDKKSPKNYGAFPIDPYSHTPGHTGARQPGLTGQVKEDILCRWGELGVAIIDGCIRFRPLLLRRAEFGSGLDFRYYDVSGGAQSFPVGVDSLAFTYCQTPIIYRLGASRSLEAVISDYPSSKRRVRLDGETSGDDSGMRLDAEISRSLFHREGRVQLIEVTFPSLPSDHY